DDGEMPPACAQFILQLVAFLGWLQIRENGDPHAGWGLHDKHAGLPFSLGDGLKSFDLLALRNIVDRVRVGNFDHQLRFGKASTVADLDPAFRSVELCPTASLAVP